MKKIINQSILTIYFVLYLFSNVNGQETRILNTNYSSQSRVFEARDWIRLTTASPYSGFSFTAAPDKTFVARINENLLGTFSSIDNFIDIDERELKSSYTIGSTVGSFSVGEDGSANYTVPISSPKGINGMQPSLSIGYNSSLGRGILGYGFQLNGLSAITRGGQDVYHCSNNKGVNFTLDDRAYFNGQILVVKNNATYWDDNTEYYTTVRSYDKIIYHKPSGENDYFEIETRDGKTLFYGNLNNSRKELSNKGVIQWYLTKIIDKYGNSIIYHYIKDTETNEILPGEIEYGGNEIENKKENVSIQFLYDTAPLGTLSKGYMLGQDYNNNRLLEKINIKVSGITVKKYQFNYYQDNAGTAYTGMIYLNEIVETDGDYQYNPIQFEWKNKRDYSTNTTYKDSYLNGTDLSNTRKRMYTLGDLNNDGKMDIISYRNCREPGTGNYYFTNSDKIIVYNLDGNMGKEEFQLNPGEEGAYRDIIVADFNGDGKSELLLNSGIQSSYRNIYNANPSIKGPHILHGTTSWSGLNPPIMKEFTGSGFNEIIPAETNFGLDIKSYKDYDVVFGDFDGNGVTDISFLESDKLNVFLGTRGEYNFNAITTYSSIDYDQIYCADINSDGMSELITNSTSGVNAYTLNNGKNGIREIFLTNSINSNDGLLQMGDFNGDGYLDLEIEDHEAFQSTGLLEPLQPYTGLTGTSDLNSDGISDNFDINCSDAEISINTNINGTASEAQNILFEGYRGNSERVVFGSFVADFNGDGLLDYFIDYSEKKYITEDYKRFFNMAIKINQTRAAPLVLAGISNGMGNKTKINYAFCNQGSDVYAIEDNIDDASTLGTTNRLMYLPMLVVSDYQIDNGKGGATTIEYNYANAKINLDGAGFVGFSKIFKKNLSSGIKTTATSLIDADFAVPNITVTEQEIDGEIISRKTITYNNDYAPDYNSSSTNLCIDIETASIFDEDILNNQSKEKLFINYDDNSGYPGRINEIRGGSLVSITDFTYQTYGSDGFYRLQKKEITPYRGSGSPGPKKEETYIYNQSEPLQVDEKTLKHYKNSSTYSQTSESYSYDNFGNITSIVFEYDVDYSDLADLNNQTLITYYEYSDDKRFIVSESDGLHSKTYEYDYIKGLLLSETDPNGNKTNYTYGPFGRISSIIDETTGLTTNHVYAWDDITMGSYKITSTGGYNPTIEKYYDSFGREVETKVESNLVTGGWIHGQTSYNNLGQEVYSTLPYTNSDNKINSNVTYDKYGRLKSTYLDTDKKQEVVMSYNSSARRVTETKEGNSYSKTYDIYGSIATASDPGGNISYTYYPTGQVHEMIAPGNTVTITYDEYGNQATMADNASGTQTYRYDGAGNLIEYTNAKNEKKTIEYDNYGRVTKKSYSPSGKYTEFTYEGIFLKSIDHSDGTGEEYTYDEIGRLVQVKETLPGNRKETVGYKYNTAGQIAEITYPSGFKIKRVYDEGTGELKEIRRSSDNSVIFTINAIDEFGNVTSANYGANIGSSTRSFDQYGFPSEVKLSLNGTTKFEMGYTFDANLGLLDKREDKLKNIHETFTYDEYMRLTGFEVVNTSTSLFETIYNSENSISFKTSAGALSYTDADHPHQVSKVPQYDDQLSAHTITYNSEHNKLETITEGDKELTYTYNFAGERKKMEYSNGDESITRYYIGGIYEEVEKDGETVKIHYISGPSGMLAVYRESNVNGNAMYYVQKDYLGSWLCMVNATTGELYEQNFDAWGRARNPADWTYTNIPDNWPLTRGYTGHEHMYAFNLINMNGRVYDPMLGMFLSPDPYIQAPGMTQNFNRYAYAFNNPLLYTDPSGESIWLAIGILATFFYLKAAHDNTPEESQGNPLKWTWNFLDWSGENTTIIVGVQGDSDGNFTPFGGLSDPSTGSGVAIGYNSNNGLGMGPITNGSADIIYPTEIGASINWTYVDQARNDLIIEERLNAYFNSMEYQFQMDKYLLASNGGHSDGGDPLFSWEATFYYGISISHRMRFFNMGYGAELSPLKVEWLTLHYDTDNGFNVIPYRSVHGTIKLSNTFSQISGSYNYYNKSKYGYFQFSTLRVDSEGSSRLFLYDLGYWYGVGIDSHASFSLQRAFNYIIHYNVDHINKTGFRPYRGR